MLPRKGGALLRRHGPAVRQIRLIPDQHDGHRRVGVRARVVEPGREVVEGLAARDVVDQQRAWIVFLFLFLPFSWGFSSILEKQASSEEARESLGSLLDVCGSKNRSGTPFQNSLKNSLLTHLQRRGSSSA